MTNQTYTFVGNLFQEPAASFITMMSSRRHLHFEQSVSAIFYRPVFFQTPQVLNSIASHAKMNKFNKQTFLNVKRQTVIFIFQHIFRIHFSIYPNYQQVCECLMKKRCWWLIVACMCKSLFINTFNFLHRTCIAGLSKHLSPYIGLISVRMVLALSPFGHKN